jgi:hypothetical protein
MKIKSSFIILGLVLVNWPAQAQTQADNKWDISKLDLSKLPPAADKQGVTFAQDIRPLFEASCFRCHGGERQKGGLRVDSLAAVLKGGKVGQVVVPGDGKKSLLVAAVAQIDKGIAMPPQRRPRGQGGPGGNPPPDGSPPPGGQNGPGGPGGRGGFGPPPKALTAEQVGLVRAWIDQGAK